MTSPDVSRYVDLTVYDENPVTALNDILTYARGLLPEWSPRAGQIETVLAEAIAVKSAELSGAINRIPSATTEVLLKLFDVERVDGTKATATVEITLTDSDVVDRTLPAGTEFIYYSPSRDSSYTFVLDNDFTLSGTTSGTASVTAKAVGAEYNLNATGENLIIVSSVAFFETAVFYSASTGGGSPESDAQYFQRATALLSSYTSASTTASQIKSYVGGNKPYADRVEVYDRRRYRDRDTTGLSFTTHDGFVLVAVGQYVSTAASATLELPVTLSDLSDLYDSLEGRVPAGLVVDVMSAELVEVDVDVTVAIKSGYAASDVQASIQNALKAYLDPNVWDWSQQYIRRNELIALIDNVDGVDYVDSLTLNGETLIGTENLGYYGLSGGTAASGTIDITGGGTSAVLPAGTAYYYVYAGDPDNPVIYTFLTDSEVTLSSGAATSVAVTAASVGAAYNDEANGGVIPASGTLLSTNADGGQASISSGTNFAGGTDNINQFSPLPVDGGVQTDILARNLGTLVIYGTLSVSFVS